MNRIVISRVVKDESKEVATFGYDSSPQARADFERLKLIFSDSDEKQLEYMVDLWTGCDLVDTISIERSEADWLINDFYGMAKRVLV